MINWMRLRIKYWPDIKRKAMTFWGLNATMPYDGNVSWWKVFTT